MRASNRYHGRRVVLHSPGGPLHVNSRPPGQQEGVPVSQINPPEPPNGVEYDASAIQVLEGLEAVRKRPGMYIGSTGERGLHHLIWEIVDNGVDEALAGYCDRIVLTLTADGAVRVEDNGRGIPTDTAPGQELPAVTIALTQLHAGGKFGGGGYKVSGGLHGVGVSVVNALSTHLIAEVKNRGHLWQQSFTHGVPDGELDRRPRARARRGHRHHDHLLAVSRHLRDHDPLARDHHLAHPRVRLPQQGPRDRGPRRATGGRRPGPGRPGRDDRQRGRPVRDRRHQGRREGRPRAGLQVRPRPGRLRRAPQPPQAAGQPHDHLLRGRDARQRAAPHEPRGGDAVEHHLQRVGAHLRQHDQHPRGRHPRGGVPSRADLPGQQLGLRVGPDEEARGPRLG